MKKKQDNQDNVENFDDGLTRVAPEGQFKAVNSQQTKPLKCPIIKGVSDVSQTENSKDKTADNIPKIEDVTNKVLQEVSNETGMKLNPKWKEEDKKLLNLIIQKAISLALNQRDAQIQEWLQDYLIRFKKILSWEMRRGLMPYDWNDYGLPFIEELEERISAKLKSRSKK